MDIILADYINDLAERGLFGVEISSKLDKESQLANWVGYFTELSLRPTEIRQEKIVEKQCSARNLDVPILIGEENEDTFRGRFQKRQDVKRQWTTGHSMATVKSHGTINSKG